MIVVCSMADATSTRRHIPIEIVERVIDWIADWLYQGCNFRELYNAWNACALTCRALRPRSQNWLFRDICLSSARQAENLKPLLRENHSIAKNVQVLVLKADNKNARHNTWLYWVPLVFGPLLVNLQELHLYDDIFANAHSRFLSSLAIFKSISLLSFRAVSFARFGQLTQLIRAFPKLGHLKLHDVKWKSDPAHFHLLHSASQPCPPRRPVQITHLDLWINDVEQFCKWFSDVDARQHLRTFRGSKEMFRTLMDYQLPGGYYLQSIFLDRSRDASIKSMYRARSLAPYSPD